jgi:transcriptional regulator with XRE-family HTH domain
MTTEREEIARRIRAAREDAGLSQGQAAKQLQMHRPTISEIEAGRRRVSAEELKQFAALYRVSSGWLMAEPESDTSDEFGYSEEVQVAARELSRMKPEDLTHVLNVLRSIRTKQKPEK